MAELFWKTPVNPYSKTQTSHIPQHSMAKSVAERGLKKQVPAQIQTKQILQLRQAGFWSPGTLQDRRQYYCSTRLKILIQDFFFCKHDAL